VTHEWRQTLASVRLLIEFMLIVMAAEVLVMFLLPVVAPGVSGWREAFLDATMLSFISAPFVVWRAWSQVGRHVRDQQAGETSKLNALAERMTADLRVAHQVAERASRENAALADTLDQFSMVCITSPDGTIIDVNEAFCAASGYDKGELMGQNPRLLGAGEHDPFFWITVWQTLLHGQSWSGQVCNRNKQGQIYWVQCVIAPVVAGDGQVDKYISIAYDITDVRRVQDELKANAERYNLAIDGGSDGLWDWMDIHSHEEWWSPQFFRLLGYEPNEILADLVTFDGMLHPDDQPATFAAIERAFTENEPFDVEYRLRTKSGQYRWFRSRAKVYFDDFGAATRMAGSIQDVHDRKEAQAKIREHSQQVAAIFSLSPDGFVSFDAQGCVSYVSPGFARLTGLPGGFLIGLSEAEFSDRLFARAAPQQTVASLGEVKALVHAEADQGAVEAGHVVVEMQPPGKRMLELRLSRSHGGAVSQVLHLRDVTHETEVDQMKSAFLSMAAHELRTPMASIYGFTQLLLTREFKPERQKDMLERIYRQSEAMTGIINELLDLARIESRQGKDFEFDTVDLADLVGAVIRDFKLPDGRQAPVAVWPDKPLLVWVDRQKMSQAVLNVLSNAYKYSPDGGDVALRFVRRIEQSRAQVGVEIQDHGIGLSADQLARVGERFFRADKSGNIPGTGLGVAIVKEIMDVLGGGLTLTSQAGEGTTMTLWLPSVDAVSPTKAAQTRDNQMLQVVTEFPAH
jgi:PAS domain S-box-containing protein